MHTLQLDLNSYLHCKASYVQLDLYSYVHCKASYVQLISMWHIN